MSESHQTITIYTVGHSNLDESQFQNLLLENSIQTLVDIRSYPHSKRQPQFDETALRQSMEKIAIAYHWAGRQLGGMRKHQPNSRHTSLTAEQQAFADYMDSPEFKTAANQLTSFASRSRLAIMCAEKNSDNCHRFMIADYLTLNGLEVLHIASNADSATKPHTLSPTVRRESIDLVYDRSVTTGLDLN